MKWTEILSCTYKTYKTVLKLPSRVCVCVCGENDKTETYSIFVYIDAS